MSASNIRALRKHRGDPQTEFANELSKEIIRFKNKDDDDLLEDTEDIFSDGVDDEVVIKYDDRFWAWNKFTFANDEPYFPPNEPDFDKVRLWIRGRNLGNQIPDLSGFGHNAQIFAEPLLIDGTPHDDGILDRGTKSIALRFNRPLSPFVNTEHIFVPDDPDLKVTGLATGISYFMRFRIHDLAIQNGSDRTLFAKIDDSTPNNGYMAQVTNTGRVQFFIKLGGSNNNYQTATGQILTNTVYDLWCTYTVAGNVGHIWINNVDKALTTPGNPTWAGDLTDHDLEIFAKGYQVDADPEGVVYGDFYDYRIYKPKVVNSTEIGNMFTNKMSISNFPFGQGMYANHWSTFLVSGSFTSTSFTGTSFTL